MEVCGEEEEVGKSRKTFNHLGNGSVITASLPTKVKILKNIESGKEFCSKQMCRIRCLCVRENSHNGGIRQRKTWVMDIAYSCAGCALNNSTGHHMLRLWECFAPLSCVLWWPFSELAFLSLFCLLCVVWKCPGIPCAMADVPSSQHFQKRYSELDKEETRGCGITLK